MPAITTQLPGWTIGIPGVVVGLGINVLAYYPDGLMGVPVFNRYLRLPFGDDDFLIPRRLRRELSHG